MASDQTVIWDALRQSNERLLMDIIKAHQVMAAQSDNQQMTTALRQIKEAAELLINNK